VLNQKLINSPNLLLQILIQQGIPLIFLCFSLVAFQSVFQGILQGLEWTQNGRKTDRKKEPQKRETTTKKINIYGRNCIKTGELKTGEKTDFEFKNGRNWI
jgi:hypothetical protein